jgi:pentose-5-phosphate-3-epimerase
MLIAAAILSDNIIEFRAVLEKYLSAGIRDIDIDIQESPFASAPTITTEEAIAIVKDVELPGEKITFTWDLKLAEPLKAVRHLLNFHFPGQQIVVYQSAELTEILTLDLHDLNIGLGLLASDELKSVDFYNKFPLVQFMTIASEQQGSQFSPELLQRVHQLWQMGYSGKIGIDGGVNPESLSHFVSQLDEREVDRASVGSYLQTSSDTEILNRWSELSSQ